MNEIKAPSLLKTALESLSPVEYARLLMAIPELSTQARGNGKPVVVLPGYGASNTSTIPLRGFLSWLGYDARGWELGRNTGNALEFVPQVADQVRQLYLETGEPIDIIGWSLGGVIAREVARNHPDTVRQVITMGSPVVGGAKYTSLGRHAQRRGVDLDEMEAVMAARETRPITVPVTSIYSKSDGIVGWQACIDEHNAQVKHIEVVSTHLGLGISADVFKIIARTLSATKANAA